MALEIDNLYLRPPVDTNLARSIAKDCFGLIQDEDVKIVELNAYDDRNFLITGKLHSRGDALFDSSFMKDSKFVLKISSIKDSPSIDQINITKTIVDTLEEEIDNVHFPVSIASLSNQDFAYTNLLLDNEFSKEISDPNMSKFKDFIISDENDCAYLRHVVRLFTFVPGCILQSCHLTDTCLEEIGKLAALIQKSLNGIKLIGSMERLEFIWNLHNLPMLKDPYIKSMKNPHYQQMCTQIVNDFEMYVHPSVVDMEKGYIHGDLNEQNILVNGSNVVGLIDFGDISYSYVVYDLAIAMAYIGMLIPSKFLHLTSMVLKGYYKIRKLPEKEFDILIYLVLGRIAQSLCLGEYHYHLCPENEYLIVNSPSCKQVLDLVNLHGKQFIVDFWHQSLQSF